MHAGGSVEQDLVGASTFPRHWMYDLEGGPIAKSGLIDLENWMQHAFGEETPWGGQDSPALVGAEGRRGSSAGHDVGVDEPQCKDGSPSW